MNYRSWSVCPLVRMAVLVVVGVGIGGSVRAVETSNGFETVSINLGYMSQDDLGARVDVTELANYIKKLQATCKESFTGASTPENLDVVIAVRPNQESRVWLVASLTSSDISGLRAKLEAITPPALSHGAIAFAIQGRIAGGVPRVAPHTDWPPLPKERVYSPDGTSAQPDSEVAARPPVPIEWIDVLSKQSRSPNFDELLPLVWPASAASPAAPAEGAEDVTIPPGIRYKKASPEVNEQAKQHLKTTFTAQAKDADVLSLFESHVICGPGLWPDIKNNPAVSKLTKGTVTLNEGTQKLEGKLFQSPEEVLIFWNAFKQRTDFTGLKIRKLIPDELKTFWAMISFDIEEPIFILESPKHKILVDFTSDGKILWIDDYQDFSVHP